MVGPWLPTNSSTISEGLVHTPGTEEQRGSCVRLKNSFHGGSWREHWKSGVKDEKNCFHSFQAHCSWCECHTDANKPSDQSCEHLQIRLMRWLPLCPPLRSSKPRRFPPSLCNCGLKRPSERQKQRERVTVLIKKTGLQCGNLYLFLCCITTQTKTNTMSLSPPL